MEIITQIGTYILNTLIFIAGVVGLVLLYLFVLPLIIPSADMNIAYILILTIANVTAIFLSWFYFRRTHCIDDEANPIAVAKYRWFGVDVTHFIFYCIRIIINVYLGFILFNLGDVIIIWGIPLLLSHIAVTVVAAFFTVELAFNIVALIRSKENECPEERPKICDLLPNLCPPQ